MAEPANASSDAVLQTVHWITKQGFKPVPLRPRSKAALNEQYVGVPYNAPSEEFWRSRVLGVGIVCGPGHSGPVDCDLDCPESVFFAKHFLPSTPAVFGRASKRESHYLYRVEEAFPKVAFVDPVARSTIVELRGDGGHQTVMPGSVHEDTGELIEWKDVPFPEVPRVDPESLAFAAKKIAIATLVARHMWMDGQRNEVCKHLAGMLYYLEWPAEEISSLIAAVMEYSGDDDRTRLRTVASTFKKGEKGGKITGSNTLRELLGDGKLVDRILEWAGNQAAQTLQDYNERFAIVMLKGKFRVAETTALEKGGTPVLYAKHDFLDMMATDTAVIDDKRVPKANLWLAHPRRRAYRTMDFLPGDDETSSVLNLWTGWGCEPKPEGSCEAWLTLLREIICGGDATLTSWMMNWFANIVRDPKSKSLTAPVIIGRQGAGKSLLLAYFGRLLGPAYVTITNEEHIYGRFNKHLATALLLHSEEALYGGDRKHRGIIKSLITDEYRIFEQKGVDAERIHNYLRLVLTSNERHAAPAEVDDRRFTVIDMGERKGSNALFKAVVQEMETTGPTRLLHYLQQEFEYDKDVARVNVKNDALIKMKFMNLDPMVGWWYETLVNGELLPEYLSWASSPPGSEWPTEVSSPALFMSMRMYCKSRSIRHTPEITQFSAVLSKMTGSNLDRRQKYYANPMSEIAPQEVKLMGSKQAVIYDFPPLDACRAAFVHHIGQDIEWPAPPEDKPPHARF